MGSSSPPPSDDPHAPKKPRRPKGSGGGGAGGAGDECDLYFEAALSAVDPAVLSGFEIGDVLSLGIHRRGTFESVVCRTQTGEIAGSVSNIENLDLLLGCIRSGAVYQAEVTEKGRSSCEVLVQRVSR
jgi:hypothetical protein